MKKLFSISFIVLVLFLVVTSSSYAYSKLHNGYKNIPAYITGYSGFSNDTKGAIHNANVEINSAGAGNLVYRTTYDHNVTTYPLKNNANQITKGYRGTDKYLMQCTTYYDTGLFGTGLFSTGKCIEADIDINVSFPFGSSGVSTSYDVQNVITHEICHLLGLRDLYNSTDTEKTMYYLSGQGELKKRTLEIDDKNGLIAIYKKP